jgi:Mn2+/Fe2+ NRAMP family transporter
MSNVVGSGKPRLLRLLGPGLITGAADDDPSGIATYAQTGTQFGFQLSWTMLLWCRCGPAGSEDGAVFCC